MDSIKPKFQFGQKVWVGGESYPIEFTITGFYLISEYWNRNSKKEFIYSLFDEKYHSTEEDYIEYLEYEEEEIYDSKEECLKSLKDKPQKGFIRDFEYFLSRNILERKEKISLIKNYLNKLTEYEKAIEL